MKTLKLLIICFFVTSYSFANISLEEKSALIALHNATNGDKWNSTWDFNTPIDTWHGVTVENDRIVEINLQFNNLNGQLPKEIGNLIHLRKINLGFNKLSGKIPPSLKNLKELISLELFINAFNGHIPSELGELKNLKYIRINNNNRLIKNTRESLIRLADLRELLLKSNFLIRKTPNEVC
ncbi:hypothetical protein A8C32_08550 [Flavivirga aquatica]|uniref:Two component regulator three Y domain protein n=1 Tax=Flavivirga aquatica TaxID=1849968 RepID=A0A1E5SJ98_9FLAO|nr:hypothetical protein [Flavivirga aquatica]OEJ99209.1 hypothetical protein A8C32_08550 [Flavivirga aquatica]